LKFIFLFSYENNAKFHFFSISTTVLNVTILNLQRFVATSLANTSSTCSQHLV